MSHDTPRYLLHARRATSYRMLTFGFIDTPRAASVCRFDTYSSYVTRHFDIHNILFRHAFRRHAVARRHAAAHVTFHRPDAYVAMPDADAPP